MRAVGGASLLIFDVAFQSRVQSGSMRTKRKCEGIAVFVE